MSVTNHPKENVKMKSKKFSVLFAVLALIISTLACAVGGGEPSLTNPLLSTDLMK
jgi:hypothetical protein